MNMDKNNITPDFKEFFGNVAVFLLALIICWFIQMLMSCKSKEVVVEVEKVVEHHDTIIQNKMLRDSIYMHDSIYFHEWTKADTVYSVKELWHTRFQDRWHNDSVYVTRFDSIQVPTPYKVEVPVEKKLSKWQSFMIDLGYIFLALIVMALIAGGIYLAKKVNLKNIFSKFINK